MLFLSFKKKFISLLLFLSKSLRLLLKTNKWVKLSKPAKTEEEKQTKKKLEKGPRSWLYLLVIN